MENKEPKSDYFSEVDPLESLSNVNEGILFDGDITVESGIHIEDYIEDITGRTRARPIDTASLYAIVGSAPADISGSPIKKVQFEIGGGVIDERPDNLSLKLDKMALSQPTMPSGGDSSTSTPTRTRADSRDYLVQPSSNIALLPAIAEEKQGNSHHIIPFGRSISQVDPKYTGGTDFPDKEVFGFVELDVLTGEGELNSREWKQIVRWIKYEEDLEEGSDRWGRPHIASLSFHSLIKLRQIIERDGIIMLDLEEKDMPGVAYRVVEELSNKALIKSDESPLLMRALLLKHRHVQEADRSWFGLRRSNTASVVSLQSLFDDKARSKNILPPSTDPCVLVRRNSAMQKSIYEMSASSRSLQRTASGNYLKPPADTINIDVSKPINDACVSEEDLKWIQRKETKRLLPHGAEATMVMVGDFDAIRKPIFVFVRLSEASFMFNVTEIPVPARFFSILLVPPTMDIDFIEIGRSFGALMSNKHFYEIALLANSRKNLLTGINEFLDDSIVLPPGDWDNHDLLPLHLLQSKSKAIRIRRMKKQQSFVRSNDSFYDGMNGLVMKPVLEMDNTAKHSDPFQRTGRLFGGLINDFRRRLPYYKSDITDSLNFQCFSTIIFMYFASIGLIITFAGLMGEKTKNLIGMSETLVATSVAGVFYSLIAGQPLIPIGPTGPLLVFDEILFNFCERYDIEFLPVRAWISIWLLLITFIVVAFEGSILVKWFTRFTQDIFAVLTALLLIFESVDNLVEVYENHPLTSIQFVRQMGVQNNSYLGGSDALSGLEPLDETEELTAQPNTALLSTILMLGTFFIGYFLKEFRNSIFLGEKARRALGDFGVPIAILTMVFLDYCSTDTYTQKIKVPRGLEPSNPEERNWFISPMGINTPFNMLYALGAVLPAVLIFILMFMSQQICELLINRKERKLVKGSGFHLDIILVAIINIGCGFFGAPWLCCATLRALAHVTALTVYSKNNPPGEKPSIVEVKEQRVTNFAVSLLVGVSVLLSPLLAFTPMAVLFGVFMYMGVSSLSSTQLFERFSLLFIPVASHPQTEYVRRVRTWKMHLYTMIQLGCLGVLWAVKSWKQISLAFPFFLILLVPVRLQLRHVYNENELEALDGDPTSK